MTSLDQELAVIEHALTSKARLPHQASTIGLRLFLATQEASKDAELAQRADQLQSGFRRWLEDCGLEDVLNSQMDYAIRLATDPGKLLYEEMHKLFSIRDEICALRAIGLACDAAREIDLDAAMRKRFERQGREAQLVAEDKVADWNCGFWWYAANLDLS